MVRRKIRYRIFKLFMIILIVSFLSGCDKRKQEKTTEEIIYESSGTDAYYDINENADSAAFSGFATASDADASASGYLSFYGLNPSDYSGQPYVVINNDVPFFDDDLNVTVCCSNYGELDELGRTQCSEIITCYEELPTEERSDIGDIKPSGWHQNKYEGVVDSDPPFLYNRGHLAMWALQGNQSNVQENLITMTRYCNTEGMFPNEEIILNYVKSCQNHVRYRITPYYSGNNLLADGVLMEAMSIEDNGASLSLCRWAFNVQPGIKIDYATGENSLEE